MKISCTVFMFIFDLKDILAFSTSLFRLSTIYFLLSLLLLKKGPGLLRHTD